jgi:RNA polymerase sigma factor (sigma-70 family)
MTMPAQPFQSDAGENERDAPTRIDPAIVASLFVEHADELRRFLQGVLRNHDQASDVLQVTFAKAIELGHTAREETLKGWLFRVAYHEAITLRRRQAVQAKAQGELAARGLRDVLGPAGQLINRETVARVRAALERLPAEQRRVVQLRMYDEKKFVTIAEELGLPLGTVLTRMQLALRKLQKMLSDEA